MGSRTRISVILFLLMFLSCSTTRTKSIYCTRGDKIQDCVKAQMGDRSFKIISYDKIESNLFEVKVEVRE